MQTDQQDFYYQPRFATSKYATLWLLFLWIIGSLSVWESGSWFPWPPRSELDMLAVLMPVATPFLLSQFGRAYALNDQDLVVLRFGRERERLRLADYEGTKGGHLTPLRLRFHHRTVWLHGGAELPRQEFLEELRRRSERYAGKRSEAVEPLEDGLLRIRLASLVFPPRCVACTAVSESTWNLAVQRGFYMFQHTQVESVDLPVPVCEAHLAERKRASRLTWLIPVFLTLFFASLAMYWIEGGIWSGALLVCSIPALLLYVPFRDLFEGRILDWKVLGLRAKDISSDFTVVTFQFKNEVALRGAVHASGPKLNRDRVPPR